MTGWRRGILIAVGFVVAFLIGFGLQFVRAEKLEDRLAEAQTLLTFRSLEATLGAAVVQAQTGNYEAARTLTSDFFTGLQQNVGAAPPELQEELGAILAQRDATITALSRAEPDASDTVVRLFVRYRVATGGPEKALPVAAGPEAPPA